MSLRRNNTNYYGDLSEEEQPQFVSVKSKPRVVRPASPEPAQYTFTSVGNTSVNGDEPVSIAPPPMTEQSPGTIPEDEYSLRTTRRPPSDFSKTDPVANIAQLVNSGIISGDHLARLKENEAKRIALNAMPVRGDEARAAGIRQTGWLKSGGQALVEGIATYLDPRFGVARDWMDLANRAVQGLGRGVGGAINPDWDEKREKERMLQKLYQEDERIRQNAEWESKMKTAETNRQNVAEDNKTAQQARIDAQNKSLFDRLTKDDIFTQEDSDLYFQMTNQKVAPFDNRQYETEKVNGGYLQRPNKGGGKWERSPGLPDDVYEKPVGVNVEVPEKPPLQVPMKPKDAVEFNYRGQKDIAEAEAKKQKEIDDRNFDTQKINFKSEAEWRQGTNKARAKYNAATRAVGALNPSIAEVEAQIKRYSGTVDPVTGNIVGAYDTSDLQKRLDGLKKQQADRQSEADEASEVMNAPKPKNFSLPARPGKNSKRGSYSISGIQDIINRGNR